MSIMWSYLDKGNATIKVLEDYESMKFNLTHTDEKIREKMGAISSPQWDGMPRVHNPQAGENKLIDGINKIDTIKEKHRQAEEYMAWFKPAWDQLSEDEQYVLDVFFISSDSSPVQRVGSHFGIEHNSVYKKRKRALEHLTLLLYGKE